MKHRRKYNQRAVSRFVQCGKCRNEFVDVTDSSGLHQCPHCGQVAEIKLEKAEENAA